MAGSDEGEAGCFNIHLPVPISYQEKATLMHDGSINMTRSVFVACGAIVVIVLGYIALHTPDSADFVSHVERIERQANSALKIRMAQRSADKIGAGKLYWYITSKDARRSGDKYLIVAGYLRGDVRLRRHVEDLAEGGFILACGAMNSV